MLKFKIIVEDGELYLQCIDPFEEIFEISKSQIENLELTELLDPFMFDSHRDIINALFEVYYELSEQYLKLCSTSAASDKHGGEDMAYVTDLEKRAVLKLR